jgi:DNA-binding XRE family transcriptional regulator
MRMARQKLSRCGAMTLVAYVASNGYSVNMSASTFQRPRADKGSIPIDTAKIKRLRETLDLSMEEAAKRAGLPGRQRWYHIESGKLTNITIETLERVAKALGVKAKDLLK